MANQVGGAMHLTSFPYLDGIQDGDVAAAGRQLLRKGDDRHYTR